jgi:hypothetical protein
VEAAEHRLREMVYQNRVSSTRPDFVDVAGVAVVERVETER